VVTKYEKPVPPLPLIEQCVFPDIYYRVVGDVLKARDAYQLALERCSDKFNNLVDWALGKK